MSTNGYTLHHSRIAAIGTGDLLLGFDYVRALGGEPKVFADFGDTWQRVA